METELFFCNNCRTDIPSASWTLHSVTCIKHRWYCKDCDKVYQRTEFESHNDLFHTLIDCKCNQRVLRNQLELHEKNECALRLLPCVYCECPLPAKEIKEHQDWCGSRTEECELCGQRVQFRHLDSHFCKVDEVECPFCTILVKNYILLQEHIFDIHPEILTE